MTTNETTLHDWLRLIEAEYLEMPGLNLTKPQVQRLWALEPRLCDAVLAGTHTEAIRMRWPDFAAAVRPIVGRFADLPPDRGFSFA